MLFLKIDFIEFLFNFDSIWAGNSVLGYFGTRICHLRVWNELPAPRLLLQ